MIKQYTDDLLIYRLQMIDVSDISDTSIICKRSISKSCLIVSKADY